MAKGETLSLERQLLATRERALNIRVEGAFYDALIRLEQLRAALDNLDPSTNHEICRYFPVAAVAVLETHFKATVQAIVDAGSPYLERGLALTKDRLRTFSDILPVLHRKAVTVGELVAYQLPFNSISSLEEALGELLGGKLKAILSSVRDPYFVRFGSEAGLVVQDVEWLWRSLAETFERRHILAHEAATNYIVTWDQANTAIDAVVLFTKAVDSALWDTIWKDRPLTSAEMRDDAWGRYSRTRKCLAEALLQGHHLAKAMGRLKEFYTLHRQWRKYADSWARWESQDISMGAIRMIFVPIARERLYRTRMEDIVKWCSSFNTSTVP